MIHRKILVPFIVLAAGIPMSMYADTVYNVVNDFSATTNPNGVWSYGESPSPNGAFTAFTFTASAPAPNSVDFWLNQPFASGFPNYYPLVRHNTSGAAIDDGGGFIFPTDMLSLDPSNAQNSGVRFTAPADGSYSFTGSFQGLQFVPNGSGTSSAASIYQDLGAPALLSGDINGNGKLPFSLLLNLTTGQTVDFRVDSRGDNVSDSTGLALIVDKLDQVQTGVVPEPSYAGLLAIGLAGAAFLRKRISVT
jgi:hypothetical protein